VLTLRRIRASGYGESQFHNQRGIDHPDLDI